MIATSTPTAIVGIATLAIVVNVDMLLKLTDHAIYFRYPKDAPARVLKEGSSIIGEAIIEKAIIK